MRKLWREAIVAFGLDVQIGKKHKPGLWLLRNFLWNTGLARWYPFVYKVYKWMDNRIIARVLEGKG